MWQCNFAARRASSTRAHVHCLKLQRVYCYERYSCFALLFALPWTSTLWRTGWVAFEADFVKSTLCILPFALPLTERRSVFYTYYKFMYCILNNCCFVAFVCRSNSLFFSSCSWAFPSKSKLVRFIAFELICLLRINCFFIGLFIPSHFILLRFLSH